MTGPLRELAALYGVQGSYTDMWGRRRRASAATLVAVLRTIGAPVDGLSDVAGAVRERRQALWRRALEPVTVAWDGHLSRVPIRLPQSSVERPLRVRMELEGEDARPFVLEERDRSAPPVTEVEGVRYARLDLRGSEPLPPGYHRLRVEAGRTRASTLVISAPRREAGAGDRRTWGVFLPLYALWSERSWGVGDFTDLGALLAWVGELGGSVVATLPLFAAFLDEPFEPSPYSPASRLFWNESFLDVTAVPELRRCPEAGSVVRSASFRRELQALRAGSTVDHRRTAALKRGVLEALARCFFTEPAPSRIPAFRRFVRAHPEAEDYARFRAACERHRRPWMDWPQHERDGTLPRRGSDEAARRYHLYVQWLAAQQLEEVGRRAAEVGTGLYFDMPLGVNSAGYDVWRERRAFLFGASAGAPPDTLFTGGQDWGFPPLHPEGIREQGYRYPIACLRHLLRSASVLRIDHVMGLHRVFCVPWGMDARDGAYVRYRPEEFYAILALEARRNDAVIVGEDLGTVPGFIRHALRRHGIYRSYVLQLELTDDPRRPIRPVPGDSMASLNTHDLPPFAAFWNETDLGFRTEQGWLDRTGAERERSNRRALRGALTRYLGSKGLIPPSPSDGSRGNRALQRGVLNGCLAHLAESPAPMVVVNLEDVWLERRPQNVPGTTFEYPNFCRRAAKSLEEVRSSRAVMGTLEDVDRRRRNAPDG